MHSTAIELHKKSLRLTKRQKQIVMGTLLGDDHLEAQPNGRAYRLRIEHTIHQKEYVEWLYRELKAWTLSPPKRRVRTITLKGTPRAFEQIGFTTVSSPSFRFYAQQFYNRQTKRKTVPRLIRRWLTPLTLAVWYMDDGSIKSHGHRALILNTQCYNATEIKQLQEALRQRYGIQTVRRTQPEGVQLYILAETAEAFVRAIEPHILPSMRYKLPRVWLTHLPKR